MKQGIYKILRNSQIACDIYEMVINGDTAEIKKPGQFVNIMLEGYYLRRPISVCDINDENITIIYKTVGSGTEHMSKLQAGSELDIITGLGNGFDLSKPCKRPVVIGGGVGVPPMYMLAKELKLIGADPCAVLGFNDMQSAFYIDRFKELGIEVVVATADGSMGIKGFVTDALKKVGSFDYYYACGPEPMLKAVYKAAGTKGQLSFEERMACGFGTCMGCSCRTLYGNKRICRDGPVMSSDEVIFE